MTKMDIINVRQVRNVFGQAPDPPYCKVADSKTNPATGTVTDPAQINDRDTVTYTYADAVNEYNEIDFGKEVQIRQFRQYGSSHNSQENGRYDLKCYVNSGWGLDSASYLQNFSIAGQETSPEGISFKPDGTKMYVIGASGDDVNEYTLSTAWDVSSASYVRSFSVAGQDTIPRSVFFRGTGTRMYVLGSDNNNVNEYTLSTAWDVSSAAYVRNFSVNAQDTAPRCVFFRGTGTRMYVLGSTGDDVNEYSLSSAWNVSSASYLRNFSIAGQDTIPESVSFKSDGTRMYVLGSQNDRVYEYALSTAWDVSSASYVRNFSVSAQDTVPVAIFFKPDGAKMYVLGSTGDDVNEYNLGDTWDNWLTDIVPYEIYAWTSWVVVSVKETTKVKLVHTALDTGLNENRLYEFDIKF